MKNCTPSRTAFWLTVIGAVNWGLIGIGHFVGSDWNVVNMLLGKWGWLEAVVYILVGISGVVLAFGCKCKTCKSGGESCAACASGSCSVHGGSSSM